jgi:hypothetical protein
VREPHTLYRYRTFTPAVLEELCEDRLYFANPGTFNDPLDCHPVLEADSSVGDLRRLVDHLVRQRVTANIRAALQAARVKGRGADDHADRRATAEAEHTLREIAYFATDSDHHETQEEGERWLLTIEAERELMKHYERGVCCFSASAANPLLWSHYGNQHRGICIGYGTNRKPPPRLRQVSYRDERAVPTSLLVQAFVQGDTSARDALDAAVLLRKGPGWRYEREWRLVGAAGLQDSPLLLKNVSFGLRCSQSVTFAITQMLANRQHPIRYYEIYSSRDDFKLRRRQVDLDELNSAYPRKAWSAEEEFAAIAPDETGDA